MQSNETVQLRKKACGQCDAPEESFDEVTRKLTNAEWIAMTLELRLWMLCEKRITACLALGNGDDTVVGVHPWSPLAQRKFEELQAAWKWGSREVNECVQTEVLITPLADGSILQSFQRAAQKVTMIESWQKL